MKDLIKLLYYTQDKQSIENKILQEIISKRLLKRNLEDVEVYEYLYYILNKNKFNSYKEGLKVPCDITAWCENIKGYKCILIENNNILPYRYIIVLYNKKGNKVKDLNKQFKIFRVYDDICEGEYIKIYGDNDKYVFADVTIGHTDNVEGREINYVKRPNLDYIKNNIEDLLYNNNFNYNINTILELSENAIIYPERLKINLEDIYRFFNYCSDVLEKIKDFI